MDKEPFVAQANLEIMQLEGPKDEKFSKSIFYSDYVINLVILAKKVYILIIHSKFLEFITILWSPNILVSNDMRKK